MPFLFLVLITPCEHPPFWSWLCESPLHPLQEK